MRNRTPPIKKTYVSPDSRKIDNQTPPDGAQWRCPRCKKDLFGKFKNGSLHVKYRERDIMVSGILFMHCRYCTFVARLNTRNVSTIISWGGEFQVSDIEITDEAFDLAVKNQIDPMTVVGSGKDGRILVSDVRRVLDGMD